MARSDGSQIPPGIRFAIGFAIVLAVGILSWPNLPRRYESSAALILRPTNELGQIDPALSLRQALDDGAVQSEIDAMMSTTLVGKVVSNLKLTDDPEFKGGQSALRTKLLDPLMRLVGSEALASMPPTYGDVIRQIQDRLTVTRDRRSYTIRVAFSANEPSKATMMTNGLMDAYLDYQKERKRTSIELINAGLKRQLVDLTTRQADIQRGLQEIVNGPENRLSADPATIIRLVDALGLERARLTSRKAELAASIEKGSVPAATASTLTDTLATQKALRAEDERLDIQRRVLDAEVERLTVEARLRTDSETRANLLRTEIASLTSQTSTLRARIAVSNTAAVEATPDVEIIAKATVPLQAAFPNPLLTGLAILLGGLIAGCAMIWPTLKKTFRRYVSTH